jgi:hypothetical protein
MINNLKSDINIKAIIPFNCSAAITKLGKFGEIGSSIQSTSEEDMNLFKALPTIFRKIMNSEQNKYESFLFETKSTINELFHRKSSDDLLFMILVIVDIFQIADDFEDYYSDIGKNNVNIVLKYDKDKSYQFYKKNVSTFQEYASLYKVNNETLNDIITLINTKVNKHYNAI